MADMLRFTERSSAAIPALTPPFWSYLRKGLDPEAAVLRETEILFAALYADVRKVHASDDIKICEGYLDRSCRNITIRKFKDGTNWSSWDARKKKYLRAAGFVWQSGADQAADTGLRSADLLKAGTSVLTLDTDFFFDENTTYFITDPFALSASSMKEGSVLPPWKKRIEYYEITLSGENAVLQESTLYSVYGFAAPEVDQSYFGNDELYRAFLISLYNIMYRGASDNNINTFVSALAGTPFVVNAEETVVSILPETISGIAYNKVITDKEEYLIKDNVSLNAAVRPGAVLAGGSQLADFVTVYSYRKNPDWVSGQIAGDTLIRSDSSAWNTAYRIAYDFPPGSDPSNAERFDLGILDNSRPASLSQGIWGEVTGPLYLRFLLDADALTTGDLEIFTNILKEVLPLNIIFDVVLD